MVRTRSKAKSLKHLYDKLEVNNHILKQRCNHLSRKLEHMQGQEWWIINASVNICIALVALNLLFFCVS